MDQVLEDDVAEDEVAFVVVVGALEVEDQQGSHEDAEGFYELPVGEGFDEEEEGDYQVFYVFYAEDYGEDFEDVEVDADAVA